MNRLPRWPNKAEGSGRESKAENDAFGSRTARIGRLAEAGLRYRIGN